MVFVRAAVRRVNVNRTGRFSEVEVGKELSGTIQMRSGVPQDSEVGLTLFLLISNDLQHAVEAWALMIAGDVKMVNRRSKYISIQSFLLLTTWDWPKK